LFVSSQFGAEQTESEVAEAITSKHPGPILLPFDHDDIRVYIDNLFTESILKPVACDPPAVNVAPWMKVGLKGETQAQKKTRFEELCRAIEEKVPTEGANANAWLIFSLQYRQLQRVWNENLQTLKAAYGARYAELRRMIGRRFSDWVSPTYRGLYNYPAVSPVMVHHIPGFLANRIAQKEASKVALLLMDGLAIDQWLLLKEALAPALASASIQENALMAWVPTITSVSRQAAFSGKIPVYFTETIYRTDQDEYGWRQFWSDRGFQLDEVAFTAVHGDAADIAKIESLLDHRVRALACTISKVDEIMHGVQVGSPGMAAQVKIWSEDGCLCGLIRRLLTENFHVVISADHGNIEADGIGIPKEGSLSETKGERCRVYSDQKLRASALALFSEAVAWDHQALPKNFHCLMAPQGKAFVAEGQTVVSHGGISPEEIMVPFIEIYRRKTVY